MAGANLLPERLRAKVRAMPETSYGTTRVTVILDDGRRIPDVYVAWGKEVVKVGESVEVPFDPLGVVGVEEQVS